MSNTKGYGEYIAVKSAILRLSTWDIAIYCNVSKKQVARWYSESSFPQKRHVLCLAKLLDMGDEEVLEVFYK